MRDGDGRHRDRLRHEPTCCSARGSEAARSPISSSPWARGTPSVVIALGLIMTMTGKFGINIYNTAAIMIIAYLIKYLMMGMRTVVSAMSQIHVSLEES